MEHADPPFALLCWKVPRGSYRMCKVLFEIHPDCPDLVEVSLWDKSPSGWQRAWEKDCMILTNGIMARKKMEVHIESARWMWNALTAEGWVRDMEGEAR